ncbi:hypothetical protein ALI22I_30385 [Saccharothrix sp. ALI-22-I]|uniref:mechanosensitive ion channel family protein n=1 Tax=Saccharothrix sp. ALI-22-I TaxID=1933778 RepID=UPI00097CB528|nr:hypothetical protein [Saccharothrix sp. ALI-22-I]ONI84798.1 hypothetical protein ALI22I_30385 [Saccharothrix sp. ALI-22-I]
MNIRDAWNDVIRNVVLWAPKVVLFLVILIIGWLIAAALRKVVNAVLERLHFDRAVERGGVKRALERSRYDASGLIATLVYYAVLLITLQLAFGVFGPNPVSAILTSIVAWLPRAIVAVVIVVVVAAVANAVGDLMTGALGGLSYGRFLSRLVQGVIIALGVIAALNQIGVATTVTTPVLIAVLATVGGVIVIGVGGGLLRPMQQRWDRWLNRAEAEISAVQSEAYQRGREDAMRSRQERVGEPAADEPAWQESTAYQSAGPSTRPGAEGEFGERRTPPPRDRGPM